MSTIKFKIDGNQVEGSQDEYILDVARRYGIEIPSLCSNEELKPYGACRLCLVEVTKNGRSRVTTSCTYPVMEGIEVSTKNEKVLRQRRLILELMLARSPEAPLIQKMAAEMGVTEPRFEKGGDNCILCGLCVRSCEEVVGVSAIGFQMRGTTKEVGMPFHDASKVCIGCGTCAFICPTDVIEMKDEEGIRTIWDSKFVLRACKSCGAYWIPEKQVKYICKISSTPEEYFDYCPDCRP